MTDHTHLDGCCRQHQQCAEAMIKRLGDEVAVLRQALQDIVDSEFDEEAGGADEAQFLRWLARIALATRRLNE